MGRIIALLAALFVASGDAGLVISPASAAPRRVEVPIHRKVLSDGTVRYWIPVRIGNSRPVETMLDSGSIGLRILPGAISPDNYSMTDRPSTYGYGSGVRLNGAIANARVEIGGMAGEATIAIQVVRTIDCFEKKPKCPASRIPQEAYGLGGDGLANQGFKAIIGIEMPPPGKEQPVVNPITHIGGESWIIILPLPGQSAPGKLIIDPDASDLAGFAMFTHLVKETVSGCLQNEATGKRFCGPVVFDTGAPGTSVNTRQVARQIEWPQGTRGSYSFASDSGATLRMHFTVGRATPGSHVTLRPQDGPSPASIAGGIVPYFSFAVLYDTKTNAIGLKPRQ